MATKDIAEGRAWYGTQQRNEDRWGSER